jgi:hypothetical protein
MATAHYIADHNGNYTVPQPLHADQVVSLASSILESRLVRGDAYSKPADAGDFLRACSLKFDLYQELPVI